MDQKHIESAYALAKEQFAAMGVDTDKAVQDLAAIPLSLHCWQGDDVGGFENVDAASGGGIQATGNYPGKARNADELRQDFGKVLELVPGTHRFNMHAMYGETGGKKVDRNEVTTEYFTRWIDWAKELGIGIDFNGTYFAHPLADDGFTLSSSDEAKRKFWVEHGIACRKIAADMGKALGSPTVCNVWIPDGYKDVPFDRLTPRKNLERSLDEMFEEDMDPKCMLDAIECKLFGIGSESYVVGSHEFYLGYAVKNQKLLCLDMGHFHPTEIVSDKISSVMLYVPEILLHVSRGVRWDSDHVVLLSDELRALAAELVRGNFVGRTHIGLDFFDASINRIAAWTIGTRAMIKALLIALLEPRHTLQAAESGGDLTKRLALFEELKTLPFGAVWDYYCMKQDVPVGMDWLSEAKQYEKDVLTKRD